MRHLLHALRGACSSVLLCVTRAYAASPLYRFRRYLYGKGLNGVLPTELGLLTDLTSM